MSQRVEWATREVAGYPVTFCVRVGTSDEAVIGEVFDDDTYRWPPEVVRGDVLDLGGNVGAFALWAAAAGARRVRTVEPEPGNVRQLRRNLAANPNLAKKIEVVEGAAGPPGRMWVGLRDEWPAGAWTGTRPAPGAAEVPSFPLAVLLDGLDDDVSVKCDIEGAEYGLFAHYDPESFSRIVRLVMEFHAGTLGDRPWVEPPGAFGRLVETLAAFLKVHTYGRPATGGIIWGDRL